MLEASFSDAAIFGRAGRELPITSGVMTDLPPPVPKLDARQLLDDVNRATGAGLRFVGQAAAGQVGAAFVRWPDGRDGVLTRGAGTIGDLRRTATTLDAARRRGLPVPRYQL